MKNIFTRLLCMLLCLSLVASFAPAAAAMQEGSGEIVEVSEVIYIDQVDSGASVYSLDGNGNVALKPGNHERWIDRLDLSDAKYALDFYAWLEDNIDGALVDPTRGDVSKDDYLHYVKTNTGKVSFTYDKNAANPADAAATAAKQTVQYGLPETLKDVQPYLVAAYSAFDRDHPEVFWLTGSCLVGAPVSYSYSYGGGSGTVNYTQRFYFCLAKGDGSFDIRQESYRTAASIEDGVSIRYTATDIILNKVTATDTYGKVRQLNQILTTQNCYNSNVSTAPKSAHECISALTGNTGSAGPVCEGYARAFKVLCDELDIPCVLVDGMSYNSGGSGPHMWNNVQMPDGNWYAVDVTWNDPVVSGKNGAVSGYENENYLLVGANTMVSGMYFSASHEVQNTVTNGGTWFTNGPVLENGAYIPATGLTISRSTLDLKEGELIVLTVAVVPSNATGEAIWSSDNPSVVTVDCGVVKAVSAGKAVITARVGEISAQCVVTVEHIHGYAGVITTQPTCTNVGVMTYSCSCGDSYTEAIPVTDHSYVNGTCTACGAADPNYVVPTQKFDITLANLTLGNDLTLYFYIPADACADWTGTYAVVTKPYADGTETATVTVPFESWEPGFKSGGKDLYRVAFNGIAAKEMTDEVTIEIFNAEGKAISNPGKESVRSYLDRFMKANATDAIKMRLAIDMLNYGAAAQTHFGYNTENLANAGLTAAQKAFGTATAPACVNGNVKGANAKGSNLTLESSILMNFYFNGLTEDMYAVVTFTDHTGASHNEKLGAHDGSRFTVNQVVVADARQLVTVTVYNADGSVYGTCTDSVESYVARARDAQAKGLDLYEAIIKFADSAYVYLHNR